MRTFTILSLVAALSLGALSGCSASDEDQGSSADAVKDDGDKLHPNQLKAITESLNAFAKLNRDELKILKTKVVDVGAGGYSNVVRVTVDNGSNMQVYLVSTYDNHFDADMYGEWPFNVESIALDSVVDKIHEEGKEALKDAPSKECAAVAEKAALLYVNEDGQRFDLYRTELARMDGKHEVLRVMITPKGGQPEENESFTVYTEAGGGECFVRGQQLSSGTSLDVKK